MKTIKKEIELNQTILLKDGTVDFVEDYDGNFYFLENSDEPILPFTVVEVIVEDK